MFAVSGFWHGAEWTFLVWGLLNALYFVPHLITGSKRHTLEVVAQGSLLPSLRDAYDMLFTFTLVCIAWVFFRSDDLTTAVGIFKSIFSSSLLVMPFKLHSGYMFYTLLCIALLLLMEWSTRERQYGLQLDGMLPKWARVTIYYGVVALIIAFAPITGGSFIYFQF